MAIFSLVAVVVYWRIPHIWLLFLSLVYFASVTGVVAYARFRIPAGPFLFILAVTGFIASMQIISAVIAQARLILRDRKQKKSNQNVSSL
jgi:hypothetical protein